jgi:hypothetical protein
MQEFGVGFFGSDFFDDVSDRGGFFSDVSGRILLDCTGIGRKSDPKRRQKNPIRNVPPGIFLTDRHPICIQLYLTQTVTAPKDEN